MKHKQKKKIKEKRRKQRREWERLYDKDGNIVVEPCKPTFKEIARSKLII